MNKYILALDLGTTGNRAIVFNKEQEIVAQAYQEFKQIYPKPGWVEHDPEEIYRTTVEVLKEAVQKVGVDAIKTIGITNQRETTVIWDKVTGQPVYNAIVWQCRRTADFCKQLKSFEEKIKQKTGLVLDAYFSASKIKWILDNAEGARENKNLIFGTIDTWILWKLTGNHLTDFSNASRTMLFNINNLEWDDELLEMFDISRHLLPEVKNSSDDFGFLQKEILGKEIPINSLVGDQQSAAFAQGCFEKGTIKNTYGTGCFLLINTSKKPVESKNNLLATIAWSLDGEVEYALEGSVFTTGAAIQWLRDGLGLIKEARETEELAQSLESNEGVYFVPALAGLGAPHWDSQARGTILGITRATKKEHLARAALEGIAFQVKELVEAMEADSGIEVKELDVDGGASFNNFLMQFQADILGITIKRPKVIETTALGAALLAGLKVGFWKDRQEIAAGKKIDEIFEPRMTDEERDKLYSKWKKAIERAKDWP